MVFYFVVFDIVKIFLKNGEKEILECVIIMMRGEVLLVIIDWY